MTADQARWRYYTYLVATHATSASARPSLSTPIVRRRASPWAASIYNQARAAGKDHPHAVRILARAWIRVIWRCWTDSTPYDPRQHGAAAALTRHAALESAT
jgi:hypothetical protein